MEKQELINELLKYVPKNFNRYYEPFLKDGKLLFALKPSNAIVSTDNKEISNYYRSLKYDGKVFLSDLKITINRNAHNIDFFKKTKEHYELIKDDSIYPSVYKAVDYFIINNKDNNIKYLDFKELEQQIETLNNCEFREEYYTNVISDAKVDDFVFFDLTNIKKYFPFTEHNKIRRILDQLNEKGIYFLMLCNNDCYIKKIYEGYKIIELDDKYCLVSAEDGKKE